MIILYRHKFIYLKGHTVTELRVSLASGIDHFCV